MASFPSLPSEIRLQIYEHLFSDETYHLLFHLELSNTYLTEVPYHRGIISVSRQCYEEAITIHNRSLTHMVVECDRFSMDRPYSRRRDALEPYRRMFHRAIRHLMSSDRYPISLYQIRKLSVPTFLTTQDVIFGIRQLIMPFIDTVEFVSCQDPIRDLFLSPSLEDGTTNRRTRYYAPPSEYNVGSQHEARYFSPARHLKRAYFEWDRYTENHLPPEMRVRQIDPLPSHIRVLWTTKVEWRKEPTRVNEQYPNIVYRSPSVPLYCHAVDFAYTYDCEDSELLDLHIMSKTLCTIKGCPRDGDEADFLNYLGAEARALIDC